MIDSGCFIAPTTLSATHKVTLGYKPKAVIMSMVERTTSCGSDNIGNFIDHWHSYGFATGPSERACIYNHSNTGAEQHCSSGRRFDAILYLSGDGRIDIDSFDTDGFTIIVDAALSAAYNVHWFALGPLVAIDAKVGTFTGQGSTGVQNVTDPGFQPDYVQLIGDPHDSVGPSSEWRSSFGHFDRDGNQGTMATWQASTTVGNAQGARYIRGDECYSSMGASSDVNERAEFDSMLSNGFSINWLETCSVEIAYLAIKSPLVHIGSFLSQASTGDFSESGVGFKPRGLLTHAIGYPEHSAGTGEKFRGCSTYWWEGMAGEDVDDAVGHQTKASGTDNNAVPNVTIVDGEIYGKAGASFDEHADLVSYDSDGFTMNELVGNDDGIYVMYAAFGVFGSGGVRAVF